MIVKDLGDGTVEIFMVHKVVVAKLDPLHGFKQYTDKITKELEQEISRTVFPMIPPTNSHIIVPD